MNTFIREIIWWWQRRHSPLFARRRGCTQAIGRARKAKQAALHSALRGSLRGM